MRTFLLGLFLFLIVFEVILQFSAKILNPYGNYPEFFELAKIQIKEQRPESTIYFVGDSTIFGGGASDEKIYSLPAQFKKLLERAGNSYQVINLGYPGTTGKEHLEVLRLLPHKSKIIIRTGINDSWKRHENYQLHVLGNYFEIRTLKLAMIFWYGWMRDEKSESATRSYFEELTDMAKKKSLDLYFLDYFLGEKTFMNTFFEDYSNFIPLAKILNKSGFADKNSRISRRFLSYDLVHANDLGYQLQAQTVFNWFASRSKFNLSPNQKFKLTVDEEALKALEVTLNSWLHRLREKQLESVELFPFAMKAAWQYYIATGDESVKSIYDKLANIYINIFHSIYPITYTFNRLDRLNISNPNDAGELDLDASKMNAWFQLIRIFAHRSNHDYVSEYLLKFPDIMKMNKTYSDYEKLTSPHPLELCPLLLKETGFKKEYFSALKDWKDIFHGDFDINYINKENWKICGDGSLH